MSYTYVCRMCERIQKDAGFAEKITHNRFRTTALTDPYGKTRDIKLVQAAAGRTTAEMTRKHDVKDRGNVIKSAAAIESAYTARHRRICKRFTSPPSRKALIRAGLTAIGQSRVCKNDCKLP